MGTRSRIGIENADGTTTSIYCHWDGYPENNGKILLQHYQDEAKIRALIGLGDLSILGDEIGEKHDFNDRSNNEGSVCTAYSRDRGERDVDARTHAPDDWPDYGQEYVYVWRDGHWDFAKSNYGESTGTWKRLTRADCGLPPTNEELQKEGMFNLET
jgi:hypothetical protein